MNNQQIEIYKQAMIQKSLDHLAQVRLAHKEAAQRNNTSCVCKCCR